MHKQARAHRKVRREAITASQPRPESAKDPSFALKVVPKSEHDTQLLMDALKRNVVFATLDDTKLEQVSARGVEGWRGSGRCVVEGVAPQ